MKKIVDETIRWTALRVGDWDYIQNPPAKVAVEKMKTPTPGVVVVLPNPVDDSLIYFNVTKPPFD